MTEEANQLAIVELRQNPFYIALQENRVEKERLAKIKEMQMVQYIDMQKRVEMEEELKNKAREPVKTDIFKHTFVDADDQNNQDDVLYPMQQSNDIMNRPAKDVFTFMNLNFDLPTAYYQSFGDFNVATDYQRTIIRDFMIQHWPQIKKKPLTFRIAFDSVKKVFNVILLGKNCPLSKCCKMTVCFQFDREIGGKVICMETLCPYNPLDQFFMPSIEMIEDLFRDSDMPAGDFSERSTTADQAFQPST